MKKKLKVLELFAGTRSISKVFEREGHEVFTIEYDTQHPHIDWYADITKITKEDILERFGQPDVVWASPPCDKFSVAAIGKHWHKGTNLPKTRETEQALELLEYTVNLIKSINPDIFFIENPRGKMRKMDCLQEFDRHTVTYCQYGDTRMKPTDLWTNHPHPRFKEPCKNGMPCHTSAPRGSRTGTQGITGSILRAVIPEQLCEHIVEISEEFYKRYKLFDLQSGELIDENQTLYDLELFVNELFWCDSEPEFDFTDQPFNVILEALIGNDYIAEESTSEEVIS